MFTEENQTERGNMSKRIFEVSALWDEEAQVFISKSDIDGLHVEAPTLEEFTAIVDELAPELIMQNHLSKPDLTQSSIADLIPTIRFNTAHMAIA